MYQTHHEAAAAADPTNQAAGNHGKRRRLFALVTQFSSGLTDLIFFFLPTLDASFQQQQLDSKNTLT
jgi:hypothetical protein